MAITKTKYTDISLSDSSGLVDGSAVMQRIYTILNTRLRERRMRPTFGSNLEDYLFEPISRINANMLMTIVENAIYQEPNISLAAGSYVTIKNNTTYLLVLNVFSKGLGQTVQYTQDLNIKKR